MNEKNPMKLRPDGKLEIAGAAEDLGAALLVLVKDSAASKDVAVSWVRNLVAEHVRRIVAASEDGGVPTEAIRERCRPDALARLAILSSVPPMVGGEYWNDDVLVSLYVDVERALEERVRAAGGDLLAFVQTFGPGWRDLGKVSLHLAENKGDKSGSRPFAFLATFVNRADADGKVRHLPLSAALKAYAARPAALGRILAPLEQAAKGDKFLAAMLETRRIFQPCALTTGEAYGFLKGIAGYEQAGLLVRTGRLWARNPPKAKVTLTVGKTPGGGLNGRALCEFDAVVTLDGEALTEEELRLLTESREGLVRIRGEWVMADPAKIQELLAHWKEAKRLVGDGVTMAQALRLLAGGGLDSLAAAGGLDGEEIEVRANGELKDLLAALTHPQADAHERWPNELGKILRPYQKAGVDYLQRTLSAGLGACLADDMGLGKTLQVLTLVDLWKQRGELKTGPVLIVMPASLLANWRSEAAKFTPDLNVGVIHPTEAVWREWTSKHAAGTGCPPYHDYAGRYDLVLTTYGQFTRMKELAKLPFHAVIADEAQAIKNPGSGQSKAIRSVVSPRRLALTGTPVENRLTDLWSIFDFVNPGLLGGITAFRKATDKTEDYSVVRRLTRPFILRRLKTDKSIISDLPDKTELDVSTALSRKQSLLYARTVEELRRALEETTGEDSTMKRKGLVLAYMLKFKQICDHPALYLGTDVYRPEDSGKFLVLGERAAEVAERQEKMLVFTQYREMCEPLADYLATVFGREGLVLHGGTPVATRGKLVREFQDPAGPPFFVLSVKAAGTGLTLTAANHVVHFDRWWNPAVENQASDRAYRIGQKRNVLIHKFVTPGTLEERIDEMIKAKQGLADALFADGGEKLVTEMTDAELMDFVRLADTRDDEFS